MRLKPPLLLAACLALLLAGGARADLGPAQTAKRAAQQLGAARIALRQAEGARDRVAALTQTIRAYEEGLRAMREGLRRAAMRERAIRAEFDARSEEIQRLLATLETMEATPKPVLLLHPSGPLGTARAGMLLSQLTPALQEKAEGLRARLKEVALLRRVSAAFSRKLRSGLSEVQKARTDLSQAISQRTDLPRRFSEDPVKTALLLESSKTLEAFARNLARIHEDNTGDATGPALPPFAARKGALALPVAGTILRRYNEADAAGIRRPGLLIATRPLAIVTTPAAATIRYRGPLLDYGNVIVLEPAEGYLLILAGLNQVFGEVGQVLNAGDPVGLMGGAAPDVSEFLTLQGKGAGAGRSETLYMELRKGQKPVDPTAWFALNKE